MLTLKVKIQLNSISLVDCASTSTCLNIPGKFLKVKIQLISISLEVLKLASFEVNRRNETPIHHKCNANEIGSNYAGRTKRQFKTRLGEHLGYIGNENSEEPSRLHFSLPGHNKHHLQGLGIKQVRSKDPFVIKAREHKYIQLFDSFRRGLNQEP